MSIRQHKLSIAALERIDDLCAEFEKLWQANQPPSIESFAAAEPNTLEREALLAELVALDVDYRRRRGDKPAEQEYVDRFPDDMDVIHAAFSASAEQKRAFQPPTVAKMTEMFPSLEIIELIGAGGMGAVYKARQKGLDRIVAIKILPEELGHDVKFALRFTREARTLAKLNHPNIVALYEFGNAAETFYFLMEFVEGSTLRDVLVGRQLGPEPALTIVPPLCDALQYAHDNGVIHRDIKPENILISVDGSVKIADFGLSRILDSQQELLTSPHQIMGTPRYMAPEQLEGTHNVDHRADIYSLGVVIYEMLTGELPIGRFATPSAKVQIDVRLDDVVLRTLEKEPQLRYQRASHVKSDVQSITSAENPAFAKTVVGNTKPEAIEQTTPTTLHEQELAARLLLSRRQLMDRVRESLRPLFRGHIIQILIGIAIILLGVQCWVRHLGNPPIVICGIILHVYGVMVIGFAAHVCNRISRIDYSNPVAEVRGNLEKVRAAYLRSGIVIGFVWWLMWIPVCVAVGFHAVLFPTSLVVSLVTGTVGLAVSLWLYLRVLRSGDRWMNRVSGESLATAHSTLDEIRNANIR